MIIVGGTYRERVLEPDSDELVGSGVRAAAALANVERPPVLYTAIDESSGEEAAFVADAFRVHRADPATRTEKVGFTYITPLSAPSVDGPNAKLRSGHRISAEHDGTALVFGFVEATERERTVTSRRIVLDPQKPRDAEPLNLAGLDAEEYFIVANQRETLRLGSNVSAPLDDVRQAAKAILGANSRVSGLITKRGAAGSVVTYRRGNSEYGQEVIGAHPTERVWPIGSGDVFSAGVAFALDQGADPVEAARIGSSSAAHWCSTRRSDVPLDILAGSRSFGRMIEPRRARIYLAGPFFTVAERWLIETVRDELIGLGVEVWSPLHEVGHGDDIANADLEGLRGCDAVLALLDHSDAGTIFEVGWAVARGIPVVGFGSVVEAEGMKMLGGSAVELHRDLSSACYRAAWSGMGLRPQAGWLT